MVFFPQLIPQIKAIIFSLMYLRWLLQYKLWSIAVGEKRKNAGEILLWDNKEDKCCE